MRNIALKIALTTAFLSIPLISGVHDTTPRSKEEMEHMIQIQQEKSKEKELEEILAQTEFSPLTIDSAYVNITDITLYGRRLNDFKIYLERSGFEVDSLFADSVLIYSNIKDKFSPPKVPEEERSPMRIYLDKKRTTPRNQLTEEYQAAYDYYKGLLEMDIKKEAIPIFIDIHSEFLDSLEQVSGMPKEINAAIHGIESNFWTYMGDYSAFNVFTSLYVNNFYTNMAKREMKALLDVFPIEEIPELPSSYAGALFGYQFMPSSIRALGLGDPRDPYDNLASTDNYLKHHFRGSYEDAIYAYNHSRDFYVPAVLELATAAAIADTTKQLPDWVTDRAMIANQQNEKEIAFNN